jgi:hypothetical protein
MPRVVFEPTIPAFERAKKVHALDRAATVIGSYFPRGRKTLADQVKDDFRSSF